MASDLVHASSCLFPATGRSGGGPQRPLSVRFELQHPELVQQLLTKQNGSESLAAVVRTTWALLLRVYTGLNEVCFGWDEAGGAGTSIHSRASVALCIDPDAPFEQLVRAAASAPSVVTSPKDHNAQYNTSVLIRFGVQTGTTMAPNRAIGMSETVLQPQNHPQSFC